MQCQGAQCPPLTCPDPILPDPERGVCCGSCPNGTWGNHLYNNMHLARYFEKFEIDYILNSENKATHFTFHYKFAKLI